MARAVKKIPATLAPFTQAPYPLKRRVAGYARVSTDHDEQFTSYQAQVDYYTNYINARADWEFVEVYTDEGITGTSTKRREGFKRMIGDALAGKIDLIVTKSVSRFARNTVDSLTTIRQLKEKGVEVYFEKENIWTFDGKGELLLTIMSSLAQEESRSISENCTWGQRKRLADGKVSVAYSRFLGYDKGRDGNLVINPEEAKIVRHIFSLFLDGMTYRGIAAALDREGIRTPGGKTKWGSSTVKSILSNEKYKGDARLQKYFTVDFLTKQQKVNNGEVPQYYVEGNHEAIIPPDLFDAVQREAEKRAGKNQRRAHEFSGKIRCGECGAWFGSKVWHSTSKYRRTIWRCNRKYEDESVCRTPHVTEEDIRQAFTAAIEKLLSLKDEVIANCREAAASICSSGELDAERARLTEECRITADMAQQMIRENARTAIDQNEYTKRYDALAERYRDARAKLDSVEAEIRALEARRTSMEAFIKELETTEEFSETSWKRLVEYATVYAAGDIRITFKNGQEI